MRKKKLFLVISPVFLATKNHYFFTIQRQTCSAFIDLAIDIINLTNNIDYYGFCSNILGKRNKNIACIYFF
jgi:hypothetical protein